MYVLVNSKAVTIPDERKGPQIRACFRKHIASPTPGISDSVVPGWGLRICISDKFPVDTDAVVWGPHFKNHCFRCTIIYLACGQTKGILLTSCYTNYTAMGILVHMPFHIGIGISVRWISKSRFSELNII